MKKKTVIRIIVIILALIVALFCALKLYVSHEEDKRAAAPGNADKYDVANLEKHENPALAGKKIVFLGSSVTYGAAAETQSFVELFEHMDGVVAIKEAKSGTTLVDKTSWLAKIAFGNGESYITRLKKLDPEMDIDCVVCQLSTNDATMKLPLGEVSQGRELGDFDTDTITGAMEYIIRYSQDTWNCPVVFYTGSWYDSEEYGTMVDRLSDLKDKWGIGVIDLYSDKEFNDIDGEEYDFYMFDPIHPTKAGYIEWWMPKMERELEELLKKCESEKF